MALLASPAVRAAEWKWLGHGYARVTGFNHDLRREFLRAEREARAAGQGLWGAC